MTLRGERQEWDEGQAQRPEGEGEAEGSELAEASQGSAGTPDEEAEDQASEPSEEEG